MFLHVTNNNNNTILMVKYYVIDSMSIPTVVLLLGQSPLYT